MDPVPRLDRAEFWLVTVVTPPTTVAAPRVTVKVCVVAAVD